MTRYIVQEVEGSDGIELMSDSPVGRRLYRAGDVIELDPKIHNVAGIMGRGQIVEAPPEAVEGAGETEPAPRSSRKPG